MKEKHEPGKKWNEQFASVAAKNYDWRLEQSQYASAICTLLLSYGDTVSKREAK